SEEHTSELQSRFDLVCRLLLEKKNAQNPPASECCLAAPPVLEFYEAGNLISHWGGPGEGYDWPATNHGITVDYKGNVWIGANGRTTEPATPARGATPDPAAQAAARGPSAPYHDNM